MLFDDVFTSRHSLIIGDANSGKTTLALTLGALALQRGYRVGFITQQALTLPGASTTRLASVSRGGPNRSAVICSKRSRMSG